MTNLFICSDNRRSLAKRWYRPSAMANKNDSRATTARQARRKCRVCPSMQTSMQMILLTYATTRGYYHHCSALQLLLLHAPSFPKNGSLFSFEFSNHRSFDSHSKERLFVDFCLVFYLVWWGRVSHIGTFAHYYAMIHA